MLHFLINFSTTRGRVGAAICLEVHDFGISDILVSVYRSFSNTETPDTLLFLGKFLFGYCALFCVFMTNLLMCKSLHVFVIPANNTTGGADLGKHSTSVFMAALLTAILQTLL